MSDSVQPQRRQPPRLPWPWDSPGKNTVVGCHFLLQCRKVKVKSLSRDQLFATPWTTASQAPPPMGFSRQEYWSGVPLPSPRFRNNNFKRKKVAFFGFWYVLFCAFVWGGRILFVLILGNESEQVSCSVMSDSSQLHGLQPSRLLCPWDSPGKNTGVGCHFLLQGIFSTQGSKSGLLHCRYFLY